MKNELAAFAALLCVAGCAMQQPKETYPYGMTEREWNSLSIKDQTKLRRDFYFYEKGNANFVNPDLAVEGKKEEPAFFKTPASTPAAQPVAEEK